MSVSAIRRNWSVILASAVVNLALLIVFETAQNGLPAWFESRVMPVPQAGSAGPPEPAAKGDLEHTKVAEGKEALQLSVARQDASLLQKSEAAEAAAQSIPDESATTEGDTSDVSFTPEAGPETPDYGATARAPILRRNPATARLQIGEFKSVSMDGSGADCLDTAFGILDDAGADRSLMKVLAQSKMITIGRICAENGSVVVTCRNNGITISPRPKRPMDGCG